MRAVSPTSPTPQARGRRGVTLLEMLVTVALLVLIMSILVAIFQSATGAIEVQQAFAVIDQDLRRAESTLRSDLGGVTAPLDPPLNPADNLGYFTVEENRYADYQGEDIDDVVAFTAKAPPGQPFVGRVWVAKTDFANANRVTVEPVTITSEFAEIIYFTRNGNLYRRVLLVKPDLQQTLGIVQKNGFTDQFRISNVPADYDPAITNAATAAAQEGGFATTMFGPVGTVSWLGMNDISCRPAPISPDNPWPVPVPNTLGDLTNRENRFASPRFRNDFYIAPSGPVDPYGDGAPDDRNGDGVPDYYPTLHPAAFADRSGLGYYPLVFENYNASNGTYPFTPRVTPLTSHDVYGFPWIAPGMFSYPVPGIDATATYANGLIRDGYDASGVPIYHGSIDLDDGTGTAVTVGIYNQNPLQLGESTIPPLPSIGTAAQPMPTPSASQLSTWWGRPTWKETMATSWTDPWYGVRFGGFGGNSWPQAVALSWDRLDGGDVGDLPLLRMPGYPNNPSAGSALLSFDDASTPIDENDFVWEDDLLLTGVRSFDIKVYDDNAGVYGNAADYYDLGYGSATFPVLRSRTPDGNDTSAAAEHPVTGLPLNFFTPAGSNPRTHHEPREPVGFGHEGRMPPKLGTTSVGLLGPVDGDNRVNPSWPTALSTGGATARNQVGDNVATTIRMARTYDTWSTDYTAAPSLPVDVATGPQNGFPPTLPSYPAPYPVPLTGIQIQIRAVDPGNQHIRTLTITHDFQNTNSDRR